MDEDKREDGRLALMLCVLSFAVGCWVSDLIWGW